MSIPVTCPSCLTRFNVSDKFAGKSGPCPKCQKTIKIPEKAEEVVIHAPEDAAPKDSKGRSVLKPLRREEAKLSLPVIMGASLTSIVVLGLAVGLGLSGGAPTSLLGISTVLLAFPLVLVGYWFLRDDELQGYSGKELWVRCAICAMVFAMTWGIYAFVPAYVTGEPSMASMSSVSMVVFITIMIAIGTLVSVLAMELELAQGLMHYMLYFVLTFILAWLAGAQLGGPLNNNNVSPNLPRQNDAMPPATQPTAPEPDQEARPTIPNLLQ